MSQHFDVIVLGAGPAGLSSAIYLARSRVKTLIVDTGSPGGQMIMSHMVANYPGVLETSGALLGRTMLKQAKSFGAKVLAQTEVLSIDLASNPKIIELEDDETVTATAVILATGGQPRNLGLASEQAFKGRGVSYCATCDGDFFTNKEIVAIGGGNSALEEAVSLSKYASKVTVIHEFDHFQAHEWAVEEAKNEPKIQFLMNRQILDFKGDNNLSAVVSKDKTTGKIIETPAAGAFIFIGYVPNTSYLKGKVELTKNGEIITSDFMETNIKGVFAAGDSRQKRYRQITTAVSDGTIAALSATEFIQSS